MLERMAPLPTSHSAWIYIFVNLWVNSNMFLYFKNGRYRSVGLRSPLGSKNLSHRFTRVGKTSTSINMA